MPDNEPSQETPNTPTNPDTTMPTPNGPSLVNGLRPHPATSRPTPKNPKKLSLVLIIIVALLVLVGGSAGAYYAVIVPNKPENVLKSAFPNTLGEKQVSFEGKISYESTSDKASIKAVNIHINGSANGETNAFQSTIEATASGVKLPLEVRKVDKSLYFKIGDLSSVKGLAQSVSPVYGTVVDSLNQKIANQWIEVDETLLKQANADCALNTSYALTDQDIDLLQKRYEQVPFATVKSSAGEAVNGQAAIKYEIAINDNKGAEYFKGLQDLSLVKKIKECSKKTNTNTTDITPPADNDTTPLTLWVDKGSKRLVKLAGHTTAQDEAKDHVKATFELTLNYGKVAISKPEGSKPFMEVFGGVSQLFSGILSGGQTGGDGQTPAHCAQDFVAYQQSGGTKPIPVDCFY